MGGANPLLQVDAELTSGALAAQEKAVLDEEAGLTAWPSAGPRGRPPCATAEGPSREGAQAQRAVATSSPEGPQNPRAGTERGNEPSPRRRNGSPLRAQPPTNSWRVLGPKWPSYSEKPKPRRLSCSWRP
ncbi:hypothetical protein E2562_006707 [Oryza meyeriana var. granulata]|uniref:Uncharacterized protein n=1 Tax=Oryza meyeriana var. granulata TaxID=110450 RepID=A0A6G1EG53_9ORYZ|nr:hypothetical protein E2562_006707 [Oryza meyeriana var. granulata]